MAHSLPNYSFSSKVGDLKVVSFSNAVEEEKKSEGTSFKSDLSFSEDENNHEKGLRSAKNHEAPVSEKPKKSNFPEGDQHNSSPKFNSTPASRINIPI